MEVGELKGIKPFIPLEREKGKGVGGNEKITFSIYHTSLKICFLSILFFYPVQTETRRTEGAGGGRERETEGRGEQREREVQEKGRDPERRCCVILSPPAPAGLFP